MVRTGHLTLLHVWLTRAIWFAHRGWLTLLIWVCTCKLVRTLHLVYTFTVAHSGFLVFTYTMARTLHLAYTFTMAHTLPLACTAFMVMLLAMASLEAVSHLDAPYELSHKGSVQACHNGPHTSPQTYDSRTSSQHSASRELRCGQVAASPYYTSDTPQSLR